MKFYSKTAHKDLHGAYRLRRKFLWLPRQLKNGTTRWLCFVHVAETVVKFICEDDGYETYEWVEVGIQQ